MINFDFLMIQYKSSTSLITMVQVFPLV